MRNNLILYPIVRMVSMPPSSTSKLDSPRQEYRHGDGSMEELGVRPWALKENDRGPHLKSREIDTEILLVYE